MIMPRAAEKLLLPANPWFIGFTLFVALMVDMVPVGRVAAMPDVLAVVLVFWGVHQPRRVGVLWAFVFGLLIDVHDGAVSAVGSFNDWVPGVHRLVRRSNGTRSVSIDVPRGEEVRFRYLGSGGVWFDDPDAHEITPEGSLVRA